MNGIGIVGSGIAGLHLGLYLQQHGIPATIYSDRTPDQIRAGRLPNSVARFEHTRNRDRQLGVEHWESPDLGISCVYFYLGSDSPLVFRGDLQQPGCFVDMRIYLGRLLEDFAARGGHVEIGALDASDVARLAAGHDLMVVASGRGSLAEMFPRVPERSPYTQPQRRLMSGLFRGVTMPEPLGVSFNISPGHGEVFQAPFYSFVGDVHVLNDPILGQGANAASYAAWVTGEAIEKVARRGGRYDEAFCQAVEARIWEYARPVTEWTNAALHPPAPHVLEVFKAAARSKEIADEVVDNFNAPARNWAIFKSPKSASAYLASHGQGPVGAAMRRSA